MPEQRDRQWALRPVDRWLLLVLGGAVGLALLDRALASAGTFGADEWLAIALAPAVIGWGAAGALLPGARSAALFANCLYAASDATMRYLHLGPGASRPELVGLLVVAVFAAHAGRTVRVRLERDRVARTLTEALHAGSPLPPAVGPEQLASIGVSDAALTEAGLLSALLRLQRARERQAWANVLALAAGAWFVGVATAMVAAQAIGASAIVVWLGAAIVRLGGAFVGRSPLDLLVSGRFDRAATGFLKTLASTPTDTLARIGLGVAHARLARHEDAVQEFLKARQFGAAELPLGLWIGVERQMAASLRSSGSAAQSLVSLERIHAVFPHHLETLLEMGRAQRELGATRAESQVLERAARHGSLEARDRLAEIARARQTGQGEAAGAESEAEGDTGDVAAGG